MSDRKKKKQDLIDELQALRLRVQELETRNSSNADLEACIAERTTEIQWVNDLLRAEIDERVRAEEALHEREIQLQVILESTADGILAVDCTGKIIRTNRKFMDLWQIPQTLVDAGDDNAMLEYVLDQLIDPDEFLRKIRSLYFIEAESIETLLFKDDRIFERYSAPLMVKGVVTGRVWSFRDITDRKRADIALEESEGKYRFVVNNLKEVVFRTDAEGHWTFLNPAWEEVTGFDVHESLGRVFLEYVHPDDRQRNIELFKPLIERKKDYCRHEIRYLHKDGGFRWIEVWARLTLDEQDTATGTAGTLTDVTKRKEAEQALRQSEEFVRSVLDNVDEGFLVVDREYRIMTANKAYCNWLDLPLESLIGKHCYMMAHRSPRPCNENGEDCATKRAFETGEPQRSVHKHEDARGHIMYVETKAFPLKDASGVVTSAIETIHDITERHLLEAEQLRAQKLESIGTLAGGIAHDFNNLLHGLFGYLSLAKLKLDSGHKSYALLEEAEKALNMSVKLSNQLLTFAKGGAPLKKRLALLPLLENSTRFALSGTHVDYTMNIQSDLYDVEADEGQFQQVLQNVVINAAQAMPVGGTVMIGARNVSAPGEGVPQSLGNGQYVELAIQDFGVGISEENLSRIFDPYFTTQEMGERKGTGLGLAIAHSIIKKHGGAINAKSETGKGTTFFIYLPAVEQAQYASGRTEEAKVSKRRRILLMDDEEVVCRVVEEMLDSMGYVSEVVSNGEAAIEKFLAAGEKGQPFDVVILDLTIKGGMGGEQTMKNLVKIDPAIKAIVSSGYADNPVLLDYKAFGFSGFLKKPYRFDALKESLDSLMR